MYKCLLLLALLQAGDVPPTCLTRIVAQTTVPVRQAKMVHRVYGSMCSTVVEKDVENGRFVHLACLNTLCTESP